MSDSFEIFISNTIEVNKQRKESFQPACRCFSFNNCISKNAKRLRTLKAPLGDGFVT